MKKKTDSFKWGPGRKTQGKVKTLWISLPPKISMGNPHPSHLIIYRGKKKTSQVEGSETIIRWGDQNHQQISLSFFSFKRETYLWLGILLMYSPLPQEICDMLAIKNASQTTHTLAFLGHM